MAQPIQLVCTLRLSDQSAYYHLVPLALHPRVDKLWVVRHRPPESAHFPPIPKVEFVAAPGPSKPLGLAQMTRHSLILGRRPEVRGFVCFNPIPYALPGFLAARAHDRPMHVGFVGTDWNQRLRHLPSPIARRWLQSLDFVTVPSQAMRLELIAHGAAPEKVSILPHGLEAAHFHRPVQTSPRYAATFVGRLVSEKRVDRFLHAAKLLLEKHPEARFCIVGDGPRRRALEALTRKLGISGAVDFVGQQADVRSYLWQAYSLVVTSDAEGLPWVVVEAMAAGAVPVCRAVGGIPEQIQHDESGLLVQSADPRALASELDRLLASPTLRERLRAGALRRVAALSVNAATAAWDVWLSAL